MINHNSMMTTRPAIVRICLVALTVSCFVSRALANSGTVPDYDFDWATITDSGNPAYAGGPFGELAGRGSVNYSYRISKLELTSNQFLEFVNTFWKSEGIGMPVWFIGSSGIVPDLQGPYALSRSLPNPGMVPVIGLNWRVSAMFCNWLHNGTQNTLESLQSGAYDTSTFHTNRDGTFTDQLTHSPDAKFWIPTLDEWMKAAHYDPNKNGKGQGGWWESPNGTDVPLVNGPPGIGQTSGAGDYDWPYNPAVIPLGSYPDVQSPWGLLDVSGGAMECTEEVIDWGFGPRYRVYDGTWAGPGMGLPVLDLAWGTFGEFPDSSPYGGLRIASAVPGPGTAIIVLLAVCRVSPSRRRS